jgi:hypothetical protein
MYSIDNVYTYKDVFEKKYLTSISRSDTKSKDAKYFISILNLLVYFKLIIAEKIEVDKFLTHLEKLYEDIRYDDYRKDKSFYIIIICLIFIKYTNYKDERDKIINDLISNKKEWTEGINDERIHELMIAVLSNTENLFSSNVVETWENFINEYNAKIAEFKNTRNNLTYDCTDGTIFLGKQKFKITVNLRNIKKLLSRK